MLEIVHRTTGPHRGGHGPDQRGHERGREELEWHGEMLRHLRAALQQVSYSATCRGLVNVAPSTLSAHGAALLLWNGSQVMGL